MISKSEEKQEAIRLRKQGKTYSEILAVIPVAKSTLSLWLREVGLSTQQHQKISAKKIAASKRGGVARRQQRIERYDRVISGAKADITAVSDRELFLVGTVLYWGEGAKEKAERPGSGIDFINMDPKMIAVFLRWLITVCKVSKDMIVFETYLHETHGKRVQEVKEYWAAVTGFPVTRFSTVRFKKHSLSPTKRKNTGERYYGSLRIRVKQSSELVRKIAGWVEGIVEGIDK